MKNLRVRRARIDDAEAMLSCHRRAVATLSDVYNEEIIHVWSYTGRFENAPTLAVQINWLNKLFFVAEHHGKIIGYARLGFKPKSDDPPYTKFLEPELDLLMVDPDYKGCGIGKSLIQAIEAHIRETHAGDLMFNPTRLHVESTLSPSTVSFYKRQGFVPRSEMDTGVGGGVQMPILYMTLDIY